MHYCWLKTLTDLTPHGRPVFRADKFNLMTFSLQSSLNPASPSSSGLEGAVDSPGCSSWLPPRLGLPGCCQQDLPAACRKQPPQTWHPSAGSTAPAWWRNLQGRGRERGVDGEIRVEQSKNPTQSKTQWQFCNSNGAAPCTVLFCCPVWPHLNTWLLETALGVTDHYKKRI